MQISFVLQRLIRTLVVYKVIYLLGTLWITTEYKFFLGILDWNIMRDI